MLYTGSGYATYNDYTEDESIDDVACSDGDNGLETKYGATTLAPFWPYLTSSSLVDGWDSPNCGQCIQITGPKATIQVTSVDSCEAESGYDAHFDLSPNAFAALFGSTNQGTGQVSYTIIGSTPCSSSGSSSSSSSSSGSSSGGSSCGTYTVKTGDTLSSIADEYGTTWEDLCQVNNLSNCDAISVGQVLQLC